MFGMEAKYDKAFHIDYEKSKISISHGPKMYAGTYTCMLKDIFKSKLVHLMKWRKWLFLSDK